MQFRISHTNKNFKFILIIYSYVSFYHIWKDIFEKYIRIDFPLKRNKNIFNIFIFAYLSNNNNNK